MLSLAALLASCQPVDPMFDAPESADWALTWFGCVLDPVTGEPQNPNCDDSAGRPPVIIPVIVAWLVDRNTEQGIPDTEVLAESDHDAVQLVGFADPDDSESAYFADSVLTTTGDSGRVGLLIALFDTDGPTPAHITLTALGVVHVIEVPVTIE